MRYLVWTNDIDEPLAKGTVSMGRTTVTKVQCHMVQVLWVWVRPRLSTLCYYMFSRCSFAFSFITSHSSAATKITTKHEQVDSTELRPSHQHDG